MNDRQTTDHITEDRLIDLLGGLLQGDAESATLAHLKHCEMCERHFRMLVTEREALRARPAPRVVGGHVVMPEYAPASNVLPFRQRKRVRWMSAAAVAAAAMAFLLPYLFRPSASGALKYWMPTQEEPALVEGSHDQNALRELQSALRAYEAHDTERAVELLESVDVPDGDSEADAIRRLYQASALVNEGRSTEALAVLDGVAMEGLPNPWRSRAGWVRYLALRKSGREARAEELLAGEGGDVGQMARKERERLTGD